MFALLPSSAINPGYSGTPSLASSSGWGTRQSQAAATERRRVTIFRDSLDTPWGFRLQGGKDLNVPLSVKRVFSGSPADGQLTRDDLILAINDRSIDDLTSAQVLEIIKSAGSSIVLSIETSPYDSAAFDYNNYNPIRHTVPQEPVQRQNIQPARQETKTSSHDSYQSQSAASYETSPQDYKRTTPANTYYPKVPAQSPHRSVNRFQTAPAIPSGMTEMGWTPRAKQVIKEPPAAVRQPPVSQHRSARQQNKPPGSADSSWRSPYATVEESNVPAWYGSLRSSRTAHAWESRAAKTDGPTNDELGHNLPAETRLHQDAKRVKDPGQTQTSHTYKAEIRGLMLARPSFQHAQSTSEWIDAADRQFYHSPGQARSAPETPNADASDRTIFSARQPVGPGQDIPAYQQVDDSAPTKLQPSMLFGARGANRAVQSPTQTRVSLRSQPHETTAFTSEQQQKEEVRAAAARAGPKIQQAVSAPGTVTAPQVLAQTRMAAAPAVTPAAVTPAHERIIGASANTAAATPATQSQLTKVQPTAGKRVIQNPSVIYHQTGKIERFNPVPDRPDIEHKEKPTHREKVDLIERFNPTPDRREQKVTNPSEKLTKTLALGSPVKFPQTPIERFNPTPDRTEAISKTQQAASKYPNTPVERFNPTPDGQGKITKTPSSYPPAKASQKLVENIKATPPSFTKSPTSQTQEKCSLTPVERFNPTPDKSQHITKVQTQATPTLVQTVKTSCIERFNSTPDRPIIFPQRPVERFNPTPNRP